MITQLRGKLVEINPTSAVIDCNGVGYWVNISLNTFSAIEHEELITIFTHLIVREDAQAFQDKVNKGLLTSSVAEVQYQGLQQQDQQFQQYAAQKEQEINEELTVMQNQIADAINEFVKTYNAEKQYAMIIATQGDILPVPVVAGDAELDITEDLLAGLNAEYIKTKSK